MCAYNLRKDGVGGSNYTASTDLWQWAGKDVEGSVAVQFRVVCRNLSEGTKEKGKDTLVGLVAVQTGKWTEPF
jgi:hypothetical protein